MRQPEKSHGNDPEIVTVKSFLSISGFELKEQILRVAAKTDNALGGWKHIFFIGKVDVLGRESVILERLADLRVLVNAEILVQNTPLPVMSPLPLTAPCVVLVLGELPPLPSESGCG